MTESHRLSISDISPFGPIFGKEMRVTSRRKRSYVLRVIYLGFLLLFLVMVWSMTSYNMYGGGGAAWRQQQQAELGQMFFITFSMFCVGAMGLVGPVLTATAINSERLHRTLGVLLMTPINNWQIVAGKLLSRMLIAMTLIGLSLPVLALVRLLGGVEAGQMFGMICLATVTALTGASIGLLLSTIVRRGYAVILLAYGAMGFLYAFVPMIVALTLVSNSSGKSADVMWAHIFSISNPFVCAVMLGNNYSWEMASWQWCVAAHVVFSGVLTAVSAVLLRRVARRENEGAPVTAPPAPGTSSISNSVPPPFAVSRGSARVEDCETASDIVSVSAKPDVSDNPVLWREVRRPLMSRRWQRVAVTITMLALLLVSYIALASVNDFGDRSTQIGYAFVFNALAMLFVCVLSATAIAQEKEGDTWTLLLTTPMSGRAIIMGKVWGLLRKMIWPMAFVAGHFVVFAASGHFPWTGFWMILWVIVTFNAIWLATGVYLSLRIRRVTFAIVLNLMLPVFFYAVVPIVLVIFDEMFRPYRYPVDLYEITLYYLPYYYLGPALDEAMHTSHQWPTIALPFDGGQVSRTELMWLTFVVGIAHLALATLVLWRTIARFDRIVGRAEQKVEQEPALLQAR